MNLDKSSRLAVLVGARVGHLVGVDLNRQLLQIPLIAAAGLVALQLLAAKTDDALCKNGSGV